jgi:hypothetical protein
VWSRGSQQSSFQVANNNQPGNGALTEEIEDLKKKLATKTQDFGTSPEILHSSPVTDDSEKIP